MPKTITFDPSSLTGRELLHHATAAEHQAILLVTLFYALALEVARLAGYRERGFTISMDKMHEHFPLFISRSGVFFVHPSGTRLYQYENERCGAVSLWNRAYEESDTGAHPLYVYKYPPPPDHKEGLVNQALRAGVGADTNWGKLVSSARRALRPMKAIEWPK